MSKNITRKRAVAGFALVAALGFPAVIPAAALADAAAARGAPATAEVHHRTVDVDGVSIFYREAGSENAPVVLLLHGFPSSSRMFRDLIPKLADRYHVVAPDYPGFGFSAFPPASSFSYTFANLARVMDRFTQVKKLSRYALYVQDYGAPVGFRLAVAHPERVSALVVQNGNAYVEGLSGGWDPLRKYWASPTAENRKAIHDLWLGVDGLRGSYTAGLPLAQVDRIAPENWTIDWALLSRPGNVDVQLDLFRDYRTNLDLYPRFQEFFRKRKPPTLVVWGTHDPFFTRAGADAYRRDLPAAELHFLDAGHFALDTKVEEVASLMRAFLARAL